MLSREMTLGHGVGGVLPVEWDVANIECRYLAVFVGVDVYIVSLPPVTVQKELMSVIEY